MSIKSVIFYLSFTLLFIGFNKSSIHTQCASFDGTVIKKVNLDSFQNNSSASAIIDCPPQGSAKTVKLKKLNIFKNRTNFPNEKDFNPKATLIGLLKNGDDRARWETESAAKIIGYVRDVKSGGIETANCKSKEKDLRDTHIELVLNPMSAEKNESFIVEITPRLRKIMATKGEDWSTSMIRNKYLGRWIEVEGWLFFDSEHANMAENTHPGNIKNWRGTSWEIHPVTKIKIAEKH